MYIVCFQIATDFSFFFLKKQRSNDADTSLVIYAIFTVQRLCKGDIDFSNICLAVEFVMLRAGVLHTPDCSLSRAGLDSLLAFIGTRSRG